MTPEELKRARAIARNAISRIESEPIPAPFEERELLLAMAFLHLSDAVREAEVILKEHSGWVYTNQGDYCFGSPRDAEEWLSKYREKK